MKSISSMWVLRCPDCGHDLFTFRVMGDDGEAIAHIVCPVCEPKMAEEYGKEQAELQAYEVS